MKNIAVSVPEEVYRRARIKAAEQNTSVSAMVREFLLQVGYQESDFERGERLQAEVLKSITGFAASSRLNRDEIHQRDALS